MWKCKKYNIKFSNSTSKLYITGTVIEKFQRYEQKKDCNESGGILIGYTTKRCDYIRKITVPNKFDSQGLTFFIRSKKSAQKRINRYWKISEGSLIYLGEWHTHNEMNPKPSVVDIKMIKKVLNNTDMEIDFVYLIIVGVNNTFWVGKFTKNGTERLQELEIVQ